MEICKLMIKLKVFLRLFFLGLIFSCNAQIDITLNKKFDKLNSQIIELEKKNDSLNKEIYEYKISKNSFIDIIDKVDNLYNNNFNRFIIFWGILGSLIVLGIPYYISQIQKRIIEIKKAEILNFSSVEINKLELKLLNELKDKFIELSNLINQSNEENKEKLKNESSKTIVSNLYIASKINELDKKYDLALINLGHAIIRSNSIQDFVKVNFHLKNIFDNSVKFESTGVNLDKESLQSISKKLIVLQDIEEVDQNLLEKVIKKFE